MAKIIGGLATSHAPQLLMPPLQWSDLPTRTKQPRNPKAGIEAELTDQAKVEKSERCWAALEVLKNKLAAWKPDVVLVVGDDQHENILDDNMPPFVIYTGKEADASLRFEYLGEKATKQMTRYTIASDFAKQFVEGLMDNGFDPGWSTKTRHESGLGHAFGRPLKFLMPDAEIPIVPVMVNTYYPPAPSAKRCLDLGIAMRRVVEAMPDSTRVVILASGGLSHTVVDETLDADFLAALQSHDEQYMAKMPADILVEGTSEIRNWIVAGGAMGYGAKVVDYVPCYRNAEGIGCAMGFATWE